MKLLTICFTFCLKHHLFSHSGFATQRLTKRHRVTHFRWAPFCFQLNHIMVWLNLTIWKLFALVCFFYGPQLSHIAFRCVCIRTPFSRLGRFKSKLILFFFFFLCHGPLQERYYLRVEWYLFSSKVWLQRAKSSSQKKSTGFCLIISKKLFSSYSLS